ncbi:MAG: winged helix-turn-helix transcriptional regulator [Hungatella sp.]|jgi:ArsR family transcriptional regulator|nr:winged helix-turn-helix transcriptional regulator [Hungatella sp.]MCI9502644.1 winged helix-turn-helix transcriptional regulator [Hungatella sp.]MCI9636986.1 winged helix-turn-helix transcriptional regulator [Hungatella sp.]
MNLEKMLKALGEPMRFQIYNNILERKHCVRSLSKKLGISEPAISQHLKVMREADLIYGEKYGYHTHYLPKQDAVDFLMESFLKMQRQSLSLDRNAAICHCEFRKEGQQ